MKRPLFSCVIPVKGERPYFDEALESLMSQGMGDDLEIIVQDADEIGVEGSGMGWDCFSRKGRKDLKGNGKGEEGGGSAQDYRGQDGEIAVEGIRWYREEDKGQSDALNKGFKKARGEWLFWLNADDVLLAGAMKSLELKVKSLKFKDVEWIAGDTVYLDQDGIARDVRTDAKWYPWLGKKLSVWTGGPSSFFRRELWERYGGFNEDLKYVMDIDLWTRWAKKGVKFTSVGRYVWGFRMHNGSKTMGGRNEKSHYEERVAVLKSHRLFNQQGWRNLTRICSLFDGGWFKRLRDRKKFFGINWRDLKI